MNQYFNSSAMKTKIPLEKNKISAMPVNAEGHLVPGKLSPRREVPARIKRPEYVGKPAPSAHTSGDRYDSATVEKIRVASRLAAKALKLILESAKPGMTTDELDLIGHEFLVENGAYPSTLGYRGFPKSICTSLNEVVCHGIPDDTQMRDGDILNVDITAFIDGVHGDTNGSVIIGKGSKEAIELVQRTKEAMHRGINAALPGREVSVIGRAIES